MVTYFKVSVGGFVDYYISVFCVVENENYEELDSVGIDQFCL